MATNRQGKMTRYSYFLNGMTCAICGLPIRHIEDDRDFGFIRQWWTCLNKECKQYRSRILVMPLGGEGPRWCSCEECEKGREPWYKLVSEAEGH